MNSRPLPRAGVGIFPALLAGWLALWAPHAVSAQDLVEQGRNIYLRGVLPDGKALVGVGAGGAVMQGASAACVNCHRRSGMGGREGALRLAPISGPVLFADAAPFRPTQPRRSATPVKPSRQDSRHAYDDASLAQALRKGLDADGQALNELMPRFHLDDASALAIAAYLKQLSVSAAPGVEPRMLHLATVVTDDADPARRKVVVDALTAWARAGALGGMPLKLHVWQLSGPSSTWADQLAKHHRERPVFAVLSGAGGGEWAPVHEFCERTALACLFPVVDAAPSEPDDFYTLYFSTGTPLEGRLLARHLSELSPAPRRVVQLASDDAGRVAARQLSAGLAGLPTELRHLDGEADASSVADLGEGDVVVGWLSARALQGLARAWPSAGQGNTRLIFSAQLAAPEGLDLPVPWRQAARWVSVRSDPDRRQGHAVIGLVPWAQHLNLSMADEPVLGDVYAATYFFADALSRMRGLWTREYLLETLETAAYNRSAGGGYFALSLGPGQREAAKGGHLLGFSGPDLRRITPMSPRLAP